MNKFYDQGWNAYLRGEPFDNEATRDWKDGWRDCYEAAMNNESPVEI